VLLALRFSEEIDITGVATVVLALVTVALVFAGMRQARLVREQVQDARRPVLVPGGHDPSAVPRRSGGALVLPVVNVGMAPALEVGGKVWANGESEHISARQPIPGLPAGGAGELVFQAPFGRNVRLRLQITTRDAARAFHKTSAVWDPQHGFVDVIVLSSNGRDARG
jgi:hypothetical protein